MRKPPPPRPAEWDAEYVRDISEKVYRADLGDDQVASMVKKDGDNGEKLRRRASSYDRFTRLYLDVFKEMGA